ncbi:MAG: M15 family metallopeptidase [Muribaculaceae bacterium]|nr:M15 family metallopeptidase [Muribaculaceae bacterium]
MKTRIKSIASLLVIALAACTWSCQKEHAPQSRQESQSVEEASSAESSSADEEEKPAESSIPDGARRLMKAYPDFVKGFENGKLLMADGSKIVYDDGRKKDYDQLLDEADPEDMFCMPYDRNNWHPTFEGALPQDPGRIRCEAFFKSMYGHSAEEVRRTLVNVPWFGQSVQITRLNGAADALRKVAEEIKGKPELQSYVKSSGSFYWRQVRFANRLSAHSYGMTIDIAVSKSDYWAWASKNHSETKRGIPYKNQFPHALVEIFERNGFIWGGRWYHYDTMHFEYRPELLVN